MLQNLVSNLDTDLIIRLAVGLVGFVVLIMVFNWAMGSIRRAGRRKSRARRLFVLDELMVDERRRLLLIQRDDVQHLILIGGPNELVVETGIDEPGSLRALERGAQPAARPRSAEPVPPVKAQRSLPPERPLPRAEDMAAENGTPAPAKASLTGRFARSGAPQRSPATPAAAPEPREDPEPGVGDLLDAVAKEVGVKKPATEPGRGAPPAPPRPRDPDEPLIAVKVDRRFAEMADPLEASMRRPRPQPEPAPAPAPPPPPAPPVVAAPQPAVPRREIPRANFQAEGAGRAAPASAQPRDVLRVDPAPAKPNDPFEGMAVPAPEVQVPPPNEDPFLASGREISEEMANLLNRRPVR
ncbi:flagellar biosynthetic protein FliO [Ancylobacter lacus]|uniref:flagellar biosynthetic protein FliO n=1 Tax=Ancylobacter lacus TaxID=2579970 RepID=UPI001BCF5D9B|nr:flagellar biosynthetic protein FliO [Ancylobacter lacus]MBS7538672.1 FliO/MopB family protein [Ancylobacter lacus]